MYELDVPAQSWFYAKVRLAVMVEGRGIRAWEEAGFLFRSEDFDSAFQRALAIGRVIRVAARKIRADHAGWRPGWPRW